MKKVLPSLALIAVIFLPLITTAQVPGPEDTPDREDVQVMEVLERISDWLFAILLIVAVIFITIAGYFFVTAAGDTDKVKRARDFVMYALIGVLVGFLAKGLVKLVETIVTGA